MITESGTGESAMNNTEHLEEEEEDTIPEKEGREDVGKGYSSTISNNNRDTSEKFLKELNLVLILSFLSLSAEEKLNFQAIKPKDLIKHRNTKGRSDSSSTLHTYKNETKVNEFRALERQTHKFQTKTRDRRHSRRM